MKSKYLIFKYALGIFALVTAFGLKSFTNAMEVKETVQSTIWFPANGPGQTGSSRTNFDLQNGTLVEPEDCEETLDYNCAMGYPVTDCEPTGTPNVYQLKDEVEHDGTIIRYEE